MTTRIATVVGARPQFIKAAITSRALQETGIVEQIIHTGQHFDAAMSDVFFDELGIAPPAYNLGIGGGSHGKNTGRMIEAIEVVLTEERPDGVLVYGDTDSTLAAAVAASKLHIPVAHVEAGLRSWNRRMPEEINRVLTDHASDILFCPTAAAMDNLGNEGLGSKAHLVGDVMYDAALYYGRKDRRNPAGDGDYILLTVHRAENVDDPARLTDILLNLTTAPFPVVWPLHPRTKARLHAARIELPSSVTAIEPVGYLDMIAIEKGAKLILTDSGGVQKEAFFHGIPCVTLRQETEWTELVDAGWNRLAPSGRDIAQAIQEALTQEPRHIQPYGDGAAATRIAATLQSHLDQVA